jgi:peptide/nickel transport system permease protein
MKNYTIRRVFGLIPILILLSFLIFVMLDSAPGDPVLQLFGYNPDVRPEEIARLREYYGLDQPMPVRYWKWMSKILSGSFGTSNAFHMPVTELMKQRIPRTLQLTVAALVLSLLIALPIGVYSALKPYSPLDYIATFFVFLGRSMPSFWFALMTIIVFAIWLKWLPAAGVQTHQLTGWEGLMDRLKHTILPLSVLTFLQVTAWVRYIRASLLEVVKSDFVRTARAKGLSERRVILKHALRNAMIPIITIIALDLPHLFGGTVIIEQVFAYPGMGRLIFEAIVSKDMNLAMGCLILLAFLTVVASLLADIAYALVDPRVRFD